MLIEPPGMVREGIRSQQVLRLVLARDRSLHNMRVELRVLPSPGEGAVQMQHTTPRL
jgi:hypothetical protein